MPDGNSQKALILLMNPNIRLAQKIPTATREKILPGEIFRPLFGTASRSFGV